MAKRIIKRKKAYKRSVPRAMARIPMPEVKHVDGIMNATPVTPMGISTQVCGLPSQGTDFTNRIGRRIKVLKTEINMQYFPNAAGLPAGSSALRCIILFDNEVRGVSPAPTVADILDVTSTPPTGTMSLFNANNVRRFKVLHDHMYPITNLTGSQAAMMVSCRTMVNKKFEINFTSASATIADVLDNMIWMVVIGDAAASGTTVVNAAMRSRTWYVDS